MTETSDKMKRVEKLAELYQVVLKMQSFADMDQYGQSQEKQTILNKIWDERISLVEQDQRDLIEEWRQFSDQANLEYGSRTKGNNASTMS